MLDLLALLPPQLLDGARTKERLQKTNTGSPPTFLGDCRLQKHREYLIGFALMSWLPKRPGVIMTLGNMWLPSACG